MIRIKYEDAQKDVTITVSLMQSNVHRNGSVTLTSTVNLKG